MKTTIPKLCITDADHMRISRLVRGLPYKKLVDLEGLVEELDRAEVVSVEDLPSNVVSMSSTVVYEDLDSGRVMTIQLTYPEDADVEQGRISVLAPVGAALLGLKVGNIISWPLPDGRTSRLQVKNVIQPKVELKRA